MSALTADLFVEDLGHERFLRGLIAVLADDRGVDVDIRTRNAHGGSGRTLTAAANYFKDLAAFQATLPDVVIVALDADGSPPSDVRSRVKRLADPPVTDVLIVAVPEPHVEAWYLADGVAVAAVAGAGAQQRPPDGRLPQKLRYKAALEEVFESVGISPPLGGAEYGDEIARTLKVRAAMKASPSLRQFVDDLTPALRGSGGRPLASSARLSSAVQTAVARS